ncbi:DUF4249 domain-containing protein [Ferruginibacter sp. SUN106]|uniref:DUF4249 domain-containing protein n=1 Tax=Ferruginibacter sp. SUN106 TaxID=2978348 RepID=UPI003D36E079
MKTILILFSTILFLSSCEKNIDFNLKNADDLLVVDAQIENGQPPTVVLTKSFDYFSSISAQLLANSFVHNADVTISNGTLTHKLREYPLPLGGGYTAYYYTLDSANLTTAFVGEFNKQYTLNIKAEGKEYTAKTNIPVLAKYPDSLWFKRAPLNPDTNKRVLMSKTTDPPGLGNYIRYFTKKNKGSFLPGENSVFDDAVIDGSTYEIQVDPGIDRNNRISADSNFFRKGDTVTVKLCNIDKATYTFWSTWEFAQQSIGNPFSQPNKVLGNINNGALGVFSGYAAWYRTVIAQ